MTDKIYFVVVGFIIGALSSMIFTAITKPEPIRKFERHCWNDIETSYLYELQNKDNTSTFFLTCDKVR